MVTILPKENDWSGTFEKIGSGLSEGYINRTDENTLKKAVEGLKPNASPREILDTITGAKTIRPQAKQQALKNYMGAADFEQAERHHKESQDILKEKNRIESHKSGIVQDEKNKAKELKVADGLARVAASELNDARKQEISSDLQEGKISPDVVKDLVKPAKQEVTKATEFEKGLAKGNVKKYEEAEKSIVQSQRNLKDLNRIKELDQKLRGPLGWFQALNPFNEDAAELNALGFGVIEPIVKIFNPSGPIAQKKLEQLQKKYGINATDSSATILGKVSALERYANYSKDIAEQRIKLFKDHNGNPPIGEIARLDEKGIGLLDQMEKDDPSKPTVYYSTSNGKPVRAKTLEQQEQLLSQGLITDVKPK